MSRQLAAVIDNGTGYTKMGYVHGALSWLTLRSDLLGTTRPRLFSRPR
jgi:hypothetical protein